MSKPIFRLLSEMRIGNVLKFPNITLNPRLTHNYNAFVQFRNWYFLVNSFKPTSGYNNTNFNNLSKDDYNDCYEKYYRESKQSGIVFNTEVLNYRTYNIKVSEFPASQQELVSLLESKTSQCEIINDTEKLSLYYSSMGMNAFDVTRIFHYIKPSQIIDTFKRYEKLNSDANEFFRVIEIVYLDNETIRIKCQNTRLGEKPIYKYIHGQYTDVPTNLDIEVVYIRNASEIRKVLFEKYDVKKAAKVGFQIL